MTTRLLNLLKLLKNNRSSFLFGPRGVGKTTLAGQYLAQVGGPSFNINLLHDDQFTRYLSHPSLLRTEVEAALKKEGRLTVLIDEVQKLPVLLDEVHDLLEKHKGRIGFLLTGSSARRLKRTGANLLAGRAWTLALHPITHREAELDLERALQIGTLPGIYWGDTDPERTLKAYVGTYLKEEIQVESQVRNLQAFARFLEIAAQMNGEPVNYSEIAKEAGVSPKTAQEYYSILEDTLLAFRIDGWSKSARKQTLQSPRYYIFDCGVLNALRGELKTELRPTSFRYGKLFETWIVLELIRLSQYEDLDFHFHYWRTNTGLEVDLVLRRSASHPLLAVEIKSTEAPSSSDLKGLKSFLGAHPKAKPFLLCRASRALEIDGIPAFPWRDGIAEILKS